MSSLVEEETREEESERSSFLLSENRETEDLQVPSRPRSMRGGTLPYTSPLMCGELTLDRTEARLGERLVLKWSIRHSNEERPVPNENDWIGMFSIDDLNPESFLDYRMRGQNLDNEGEIHWLLLHQINSLDSMQVCFCFYTSNNLLLAQSDTLVVTNDAGQATPTISLSSADSSTHHPLVTIAAPPDELISIRVQGLSCSNLRLKTFGSPEPFIKLSVTTNDRGRPKLTHHRQLVITSVANATCNPSWEAEEFTLTALPNDFLEVEVRDKFSFSRPSASHFLGKALIPLSFLSQQQSLTKSYQLVKRLPSDRVSGSVSMTIISNNVDLPIERNTPDSSEQVRELDSVQESVEEVQSHQLPERSSDRIRWVRRTLHGDHYRRDSHFSRQRHSSFVGPRNRGEPSTSSVEPQTNLHLGIEQFMARSSRNQFMRQNSCPVNRRGTPSPYPSLESEPHPLALPHTADNAQSHTAEIHSHSAEPQSHTAETHSHSAESQSHTTETTIVEDDVNDSESHATDTQICTEAQLNTQSRGTETQPSTIEAHIESESHIVESEPHTIESESHTVESHTDDSYTSPPSTPLSPVIVLSEGSSIIDTTETKKEEVNGGSDTSSIAPNPSITLMLPPSLSRVDSVDDSVKDHPGFLFLTRNDFYEFVKSTGSKVFLQDLSLLKLVQSIRSDHSLYSKYSHSSRLVRAINSFALVDCELPDGWEKRLEKGSHKVVYVDHNSQTTTFIDPRLPIPGRHLNTASDRGVMRSRPIYSANTNRSSSNPETAAPPAASNNSRSRPPERSMTTPTNVSSSSSNATDAVEDEASPQTYSAKVVNFLRQPDIYSILSSEYSISDDLRSSIEEIRSVGVPGLEQLQNQDEEIYLELAIVLSFFEETITHQLFGRQEGSSHISRSSLPPPPSSLTPPPPPSHAPTAPPYMIPEENAYAGIPLEYIVEFFQQSSVYHTVLARFGNIQPYMRTIIQEFSASEPFEVSEELVNNSEARQFIFELREDIQQRYHLPYTNAVNEDNVIPSSETLPVRETIHLHEDNSLPLFPTAAQVRAYMAQPDILTRLTGLDPDERSIVQVCGSWDLSLIDFELNRSSVLRDLVLRLDNEIRQFTLTQRQNESSPLQPLPIRIPTPPPPPPLPSSSHSTHSFVRKLQQLQTTLDSQGYGRCGRKDVTVRREHLLEDAYRFIMSSSAKSLRLKGCHLTWCGEEGLDYGGPQREFFFKLSRLLFNPFYGLFEYTTHGAYTVQISRYSSCIDDAHLWFRFAGRVIGYALIQNQLLDVFFARHVYKSLLGIPFTVSDVETLDLSFYNSLKYVLDDDPAPLELTFTVPEESFGEIIDKELKPGGSQIPVTEDNKKEYVELMTTWKLTHGVQQQMNYLLEGLKEMIPLDYLKPFDARELEWVIAGTPEINMEDWKKNTQYWGGYHDHHNVIEWFWEAMESFTNEQKLKFLQFTTGTSSIPYEGFKALRGSSQNLQKFTIDRYTGPIESLVIAHTCFNRIDLPPYRSLDEMKAKLLFAILETDSFESA